MKLSLLLGSTLVMAVAAMTAEPAYGCVMNGFQLTGLNPDGKAAAGQDVTFRVGFQDADARTGSVKIDYGDGTAADTGPRTIERTWGQTGAYISVKHVYTKPGTFNAALKGGTVENQPCAASGYFGFGALDSDGSPRLQVHVVASPLQSATKHADATHASALTQPNSVAAEAALQVPALTQSNSVVAKGNVAHALRPGQIARASVSTSVLGSLLKVEGSGTCALKTFEEVDGKVVRTYDFKGPLPTTIQLLNTLPGLHILKIEGDKSSEGCGGTASASLPIARTRGVLRP